LLRARKGKPAWNCQRQERVMPMQYRVLRYGFFTAGLVLAGFGFLVCLANAMALEGGSESVERLGIFGNIAGSIIAGSVILVGAVISRRLLPLVVVVTGGLSGAAGGWFVGELLFPRFNWLVAGCLAPIGMWLGWLGAASRSRGAVGAALGGTVGALLGALAFPILFNMEGPPMANVFWALAGLLIGGLVGILLGVFVGWSRTEQEQLR
jgi:hypothetical protein